MMQQFVNQYQIMIQQSEEGQKGRSNKPIQFTEISHNQSLTSFGQEIQFEPHPHRIIDLSKFLLAMFEQLRGMLLDSHRDEGGNSGVSAGPILPPNQGSRGHGATVSQRREENPDAC